MALEFQNGFAQISKDSTIVKKEVAKPLPKKWFDTFSIRGYMQVRYNRLLENNPKLKCEQCDRSIGEGGGFFVRRMRIIFSGNVSETYIFMYSQTSLRRHQVQAFISDKLEICIWMFRSIKRKNIG